MNPTTRRFPRTLNEAFDEGTSREIEDEGDTWQQIADMLWSGLALLGVGVACVVCFIWLVMEWGRVDVRVVHELVDNQTQTCGSCRQQPKTK